MPDIRTGDYSLKKRGASFVSMFDIEKKCPISDIFKAGKNEEKSGIQIVSIIRS